LTRFLTGEVRISTQVFHRYGIRVLGETIGDTYLGLEKQAIGDAVAEAFKEAQPFLSWFFHSDQFVHFCRPIYIGIAKDLYERVYNQHYLALNEYWDDSSRVSRFLSSNGEATVQDAMDQLDLPHSFALEARVRGISTADLMVAILATDEIPS